MEIPDATIVDTVRRHSGRRPEHQRAGRRLSDQRRYRDDYPTERYIEMPDTGDQCRLTYPTPATRL